jgi:Trk K+ transport system NAD-binding subunit
VVVIESQRDGRFMAAARRINVTTIVGDATVLEILRQANAGTARAVIAATNNELANIEIALLARDLNPKQRVVVRLNDPQLSDMLREAANIGLALSLSSLAAPAFVAALFGDRVLSVFLARRRLMAAVEFHIAPDDTPLIGQTVRALSIDYQLLPVILRAADGNVRPQLLNHRCAIGDRLTCVMSLADLGRVLRREQVSANRDVQVTSVQPPGRTRMIQLLKERCNLASEAAQAALNRLPVTVATNLSLGQAEDIRFMLSRDGIESKLVIAERDGRSGRGA